MRRSVIHRAGLLIAVVLLGAAAAWGQSAVNLNVQVIHASNTGKAVDPALAKIRSQLSSFKYTNYALLETRPFTTAIGAKHAMPLPGGKILDLYPYGVSGGSLELLVTITDGAKRVLDTTFRLSNGGTILVGGPTHADGVLIVAISGSF
ncbi:MAG: hypothetical protein ABIO65_10110 [Nitrospiria bacterium]